MEPPFFRTTLAITVLPCMSMPGAPPRLTSMRSTLPAGMHRTLLDHRWRRRAARTVEILEDVLEAARRDVVELDAERQVRARLPLPERRDVGLQLVDLDRVEAVVPLLPAAVHIDAID